MSAKGWKTKTIKHIELLQSWSKTRKFHCISCKSETPPSIKMTEGRLCQACAIKRLKDNLMHGIDIQNWSINQFANYLKNGSPAERLLVLYRFMEVISIVGQKDGTKAFQLYQPLIRNMAYINQHPLSTTIRQVAHEASVEVGESLLPILVSTKGSSSSVFYANALLTAASIDPENVEVKRMMVKAARESSASVKKILLNAFSAIDESWIVPLLDILRNDKNTKIKEKAQMLYFELVPEEAMSNSKVVPVQVNPDLVEEIKNTYPAEQLKMLYDAYLHLFFDKSYFGMLNQVIRSKLKKVDLIHAYACLMSNEENFWLLMNALPEDVYSVFERLAWEGLEFSAEELNKSLQEKISFHTDTEKDKQVSTKTQLNPKYSLFKSRKVQKAVYGQGWINDYYISLPPIIKASAKKYLPKPKFYELIGISEDPENCEIYQDDGNILHQLPLILSYAEANDYFLDDHVEKPTKKILDGIIGNCSLQEFYHSGKPNEKYLRSNIIAFFMSLENIFFPKKFDRPEHQIKHMLFTYLKGEDSLVNNVKILPFLTYLKQWKKIFEQYPEEYHFEKELNLRNNLWRVLKQAPKDQWISVENIINHCYYRNISMEVIHPYIASQYIFFSPCRYINDKWQDPCKVYLSEAYYSSAITIPAVKMVLFFLASFGIIDIAYRSSHNDKIRVKGRNYLSEYDGLEYIRLNKLSEYVMGKTDQYEVNQAENVSSEVILDDSHLIAYYKGKDPVKRMILEKMALRIHEGCYRVNYQIFLKDCQYTKDIDNKINLFHDHISSDPPKIWKDFIKDILSKKDPLEEKPNYHVFKLNDNQELVELIARDEQLRQYVMMAEKYHILVPVDKIHLLQKRLANFGFFMDC